MHAAWTIRELELRGAPRERGRQHGEALRAQIHEHLPRREARLLDGSGMDRDAFLAMVYETTGFLAAAERQVPDLVEEIRGIAEGAGLSFARVFAGQLLDELHWLKVRRGLGPDWRALDESHCSTVAVRSARPLLAQNVDMGSFAQGHGVLLRLPGNNGRGLLTLTLPGVIGIYGLNGHGLGLCLNAMAVRLSQDENGLGSVFVARSLLACRDRAAAESRLRNMRLAGGEVYTLADATGIDCWEASPHELRAWAPAAPSLAHTNHPLVNGDVELTPGRIARLPEAAQRRLEQGAENSSARLAALQDGLAAAGQPDVAGVMRLLSSHIHPRHPVCRHDRGDGQPMTNFCLVMECGSQPLLHLADGPPCTHPFRSFSP